MSVYAAKCVRYVYERDALYVGVCAEAVVSVCYRS